MSDVILKAENISKQYRLGLVGTGTISHDLNRWWHRIWGKEDPYLKIGEINDRSSKGNSEYVWALQDINFEVKRGEVLGIIGKNGAGKSTLLKILSRVTSPTVGEIKTKGRIASLLEVGTGFHPEMTGRENIYLNGAILGMTKREIAKKIDEIIAFSGCERYIDTPVKRYSSGMTVRLAFAVAAFLEPDILVIDEVLAVGDAEFQKKAIGKMQDISQGEGRTVLFVSHNMGAIKNLCSRCVVLQNGRVSCIEPTEIAVNKYLLLSENSSNHTKVFAPLKNPGVAMEKVSIFNNNINTTNFQSGDDLKIVIKLNNFYPVKDVNLMIGLYDSYQEKVAHFDLKTLNYIINPSSKEVIFLVKHLPLINGAYSLNFVLQILNSSVQVESNALRFYVEPGDYYKNGKNVISNNRGDYLMDYSVSTIS
ncbi:ABC transporter ATP-binding protein [Algibacter mikhailovii]|uniref:ABC transporter ATP-binding protein n=1 Tax=Algibacter mikhailovii TaxID=425498 RepID=UPI0024942EEF|nr:ABC transporter ATP-binding protein [Algibacter mikhailovii]